nr:tripartite tricarboxylate transporter TctB family protein [Lutibaculum baratangense]
MAVIVSALAMPRPGGWGQAPGLFPLICGSALLVMAAILATSVWRRSPREEAAPDEFDTEEMSGLHLARILIVAGSVAAYALILIPLLSFFLATLVYLAATLWYFWRGWWVWIILISLATTIFLTQTFERFFSVMLP